MTAITGALVRTENRHFYVGRPTGVEKFFRIETSDDKSARGVVEKYLELHSDPDFETTSVTGPGLSASQVPGAMTFHTPDSIGGKQIQSITVSSADEMWPEVTLELGDPLAKQAEDLQRQFDRLALGVQNAHAAPEVQWPDKGQPTDNTPPPYSLGQVLYPSRSPAWSVPSPFWFSFFEVTLEEPGKTPSLIRLWKNSELAVSCELAAGQKRKVVKVRPETRGLGFSVKDFIICEVKIAGTDAANVACVMRGAVIQAN